MTNKEYIENVMKTDAGPKPASRERIVQNFNLIHACMGICTESGELMDAIKKTTIYGKPLDVVNLIEEMGDLFWYLGLMANELHVSFDTIMGLNIEKLRKRYPNNFTEQDALVRDLDAERKVLESDAKG